MAVDWNDEAFKAAVHRGAAAGLARWINLVDAKSVDLILNTKKTGRVYRRRGVEHQASAAGEPPASDTGRLVNSRRVEVDTENLRARLAYGTEYALYLSLGTYKMEPRPWLFPALEQTFAEGVEAVRSEIRAATS